MSNWALKFQGDDVSVVTCEVDDAPDPYETSVRHPEYNDERWVIVEVYRLQDDAVAGHEKWVRIITESPPDQLVDVGESLIAKLLDSYHGGRGWRTMVRVPRT
jgi:hypothetical protein